MKHVLISTILFVLVGLCQQAEQYHEMDLINRLNPFYGFDHNIYFLDTLTDHNRLNLAMNNNAGNFAVQTVYIFNHNLVGNNGTQFSTLKSLTSKKTFLIIMATSLQFEGSTQLLSQMKVIQRRLGANVNIGVFFVNEVTSMDLVEQLFRWSWSTGFAKIFCAFYSNTWNVFGYDPFVTFDLINLTESESLQNYFPSGVPNYHGHPLRCVLAGYIDIDDVEVKFWDSVIRAFNASKSEIIVRPGDKDIDGDILVHETPFEDAQCPCYPHRMTTFILMAPHAQPYSDFIVYLQNATWTLIFIYTSLAVTAASLVLIVSGYLQTKKISIFKCVTDIVNLLMNDNGVIRYGRLKSADVCIIVPFTFAGLIAVNGILSVFQSYITMPIYERQINTVDDLFKSPIKILANEEYWAKQLIVILEDLSRHGGWRKKIQPMNLIQLLKEVQSFNHSVAFIAQMNDVRVCVEAQKRLGIKAYHLITEPYLKITNVGFMVFRSFPFIEPVNDLVHRLLSAGLIQKWLTDINHSHSNELLLKNIHLQVEVGVEPASIGGEFGVPNVVWCGWITSVIVFIGEVAWNRLKLQFTRMKERKKKQKTGHYAANKKVIM